MNNHVPMTLEEKKQLLQNGKSFLACLEILNEKMNISASTSALARYCYWLIRCLIDQGYIRQAFDSRTVNEMCYQLVSGQFRREVSPCVAGSTAADKAITTLEAMAAQNVRLLIYR